jgi:hypothetical protein
VFFNSEHIAACHLLIRFPKASKLARLEEELENFLNNRPCPHLYIPTDTRSLKTTSEKILFFQQAIKTARNHECIHCASLERPETPDHDLPDIPEPVGAPHQPQNPGQPEQPQQVDSPQPPPEPPSSPSSDTADFPEPEQEADEVRSIVVVVFIIC